MFIHLVNVSALILLSILNLKFLNLNFHWLTTPSHHHPPYLFPLSCHLINDKLILWVVQVKSLGGPLMFLFHPTSFPISRKPVSIFFKIFLESYHFPLLPLLLLFPKLPIRFQCITVISLQLFSLSFSWSHFNLFLPHSRKIILLKCRSHSTGPFSGPLFQSELKQEILTPTITTTSAFLI